MTTHTNARSHLMPADSPRRVWTPRRDATLIALHRTGLSYAAIASHMGISYNAAAARIAVLIRRGILPAKRGKWAAGGTAAPGGG
jgi:predicted ArsR family transcriptional regulator